MTVPGPVRTATEITTIAAADCRCVALAPDGSALAVMAGQQITFYEYPDRAIWSVPCDPPPDSPAEIAWGGDADRLYVLAGGRLQVYDTDAGEVIAAPRQLADVTDLTAVAAAPGGRLVAIGTRAGPLFVLDQRTGTAFPLRGADPVTAVAWHPNGTELCVGREDVLQFWDVQGQAMITSLPAADPPVGRLAWSPDGRLLVAVGASGAQAIRVASIENRWAGPRWESDGLPVAACFSREGTRLLIGLLGADVMVTDREFRPSGRIRAEISYPGTLDINAAGILVARAGPRAVGIWALPDAARSVGRSAATDRRWAARHGRTVGRRPAAAAEIGIGAVTPTVLPSADEPAPDSPAPAFAWWPDSHSACAEISPGLLARIRPPSVHPLWQRVMGGGAMRVAIAPRAGLVGAAGDTSVTILDGAGQLLADVLGGRPLDWSPDAQPRLAVAEPERRPRQILVYDSRDGFRTAFRLPMADGVASLAWSPDGRSIAAGGRGQVVLWDVGSRQREQRPLPAGSKDLRPAAVAWSPDGRRLAAAVRNRDQSSVIIWNSGTGERHRQLSAAWHDAGPSLAWSSDARILAVPGPAATLVSLWDTATGERLRTLPHSRAGRVSGLSWSPDGDALAVTQVGGQITIWDVSIAVPAEAGNPGELPFDRDILVRLAQVAAAERAAVPLSVLARLLALVTANVPDELRALAGHRGTGLLRGLHWPVHAGIGLAVLLAADLPPDPRHVPAPDATDEDLASALRHALDGPPCPPSRPPVPIVALTAALNRVDDRLLTLLTLLGPDAVAAEPGLPARLRHVSENLTPLTPGQRRLLAARVLLTGEGSSQGSSGGSGRTGLARHGRIDALLPTQLAFAPAVLAALSARDELLYRTKDGSLPPRPRATILVLDDTAAAHGKVGIALRLIGHLVAASLIREGRRCSLILLGQPTRTAALSRPGDLVRIWTAGTDALPDPGGALRQVEALAAESVSFGDSVSVILLTHPYQPALAYPGYRTVRVHYPGQPVVIDEPSCYVLSPDPTPADLSRLFAWLLRGPSRGA